jgi:hypothetical protein
MTSWTDHWAAINEAAHAVVARHFGMEVPLATLDFITVPHLPYTAPDCDNSKARLVMSAAGDVATTIFLRWTGTDHADNEISRKRLRGLGAGFFLRRRLMREARQAAFILVWALRGEILTVAGALRERRVMSQDQIDELLWTRRISVDATQGAEQADI